MPVGAISSVLVGSVNVREPMRSDDMQENWASGEDFSRYAQTDLDRWRQAIGQHVHPDNARWGVGCVESVSWGSCCEHVPAYIQIKIRYQGDLTVVFSSDTWHEHHVQISVSPEIQTVIRTCLDSALSSEDQAECLSKHAITLRERHDQALLDRVARRAKRLDAS